MTWIIVIEFRSREVPQVFKCKSEEDANITFSKLCTTKPYRITLWEEQFGTKEMHEFARIDNSLEVK